MTHEVNAPLVDDSRGDETPTSDGCREGAPAARPMRPGFPSSTPARSRTTSGMPRFSVPSTVSQPDTFDVEYLQSGPGAWRLSLIRKDA